MSSNLFGIFGKKEKDKDPKGSVPAPAAMPMPGGAMPPAPGLTKPSLVPVTARPGTPAGNHTTQPLVLPKASGDSGLRAAKPAGVGKSTQRIVLPGRGTARTDRGTTESSPASAPTIIPGNVSLPLGMLIRVLPEGVGTISAENLENSPVADEEFNLPLQMIVPQLPSGKVLLTIQEVLPHVPRHLLIDDEALAPYLGSVLSLPLMDVVMRIPPDVMSLRPDQKGVDAAVLNMADPFTEQLLREAAQARAEAANALSRTAPAAVPPASEIIEESEVKTGEEFVPQEAAVVTPIQAARVTPPTRSTNRIPTRPKSQVLPKVTSPTVAAAATAKPAPPSFVSPSTMELPTLSRPLLKSSAPLPPLPEPSVRVPVAPRVLTPEPAVESEEPIIPDLASLATQAESIEPEEAPSFTPEAATSWSDADELKKLLAAAEAQLESQENDSAGTLQIEEEAEATALEPVVDLSAPEPMMPEPVVAPPRVEPPAPKPLPPSLKFEPKVVPPVASWTTPSVVPKASTLPPKETPEPHLPVAIPKLAENTAAHKITEPVPSAAPVVEAVVPKTEAVSNQIDLNHCTIEQLLAVPGCPRTIAEAIVRYREKNGDYQKLEELLQVPGMTALLYALLTGQSDPRPPIRSLNELLGFPAGQKISLKDVCDRVASWPNITGIVLGHASGLPMVGHVPVPFESTTIMAFAPKIFATVNQSYRQFAGEETHEIIFPAKGTSFHLYHSGDLYAVVLSSKRSLPRGQAKLLRQVIGEIVRQEKDKSN